VTGRCDGPKQGLSVGLVFAPLATMSSGIWAAASGAVGQVALLDTASNNLANIDTNGYQVDRLVFRRALTASMGTERAHPSLEYNVARSALPDQRAGRIVPTGRALDVALSDDNAYFSIQTDQGIRYTRAGSLQIMPDGVLAMPDGRAYLDAGSRPIVIPEGVTDVEISGTGELTANGELLGQKLAVFEFENPEALQKEGDLAIRAPLEAGGRHLIDPPYLQTHALEKATDRAFEHMSSVVDASRNFDILSQVIQAFRDVEKSAARDIAGT
jgi:flagellar basal-body rod protein FlgF